MNHRRIARIALGAVGGPPEVRAVSGTSPTLLDSGAGIGRSSLRLEGNTLSWVEDGSPRTAPFE
jgi:hypothetical protein